jgi:hypothetical protein
MAITCPLCRSDLPRWLPRRALDVARRPDDGPSLELVSVREQIEAEEAERRPAHLRRLQRERRIDEYAVFTISGRPYEDLPIAGPQVRPSFCPTARHRAPVHRERHARVMLAHGNGVAGIC